MRLKGKGGVICLTITQEKGQALELHIFCDSTGKGTAAAVYAVMYRESGMHQGVLAERHG